MLVRFSPGGSDPFLPFCADVERMKHVAWLRLGANPDGVFAGWALHHRMLQPRVGVVGFVMSQHRQQLPGMLVGVATNTLSKGFRRAICRIHICSGVYLSTLTALARCRLLRAPWISSVRR